MRVTEHWQKLSREAMESPSLGDIQNFSGHSPGPSTLDDPA